MVKDLRSGVVWLKWRHNDCTRPCHVRTEHMGDPRCRICMADCLC